MKVDYTHPSVSCIHFPPQSYLPFPLTWFFLLSSAIISLLSHLPSFSSPPLFSPPSLPSLQGPSVLLSLLQSPLSHFITTPLPLGSLLSPLPFLSISLLVLAWFLGSLFSLSFLSFLFHSTCLFHFLPNIISPASLWYSPLILLLPVLLLIHHHHHPSLPDPLILMITFSVSQPLFPLLLSPLPCFIPSVFHPRFISISPRSPSAISSPPFRLPLPYLCIFLHVSGITKYPLKTLVISRSLLNIWSIF